LTIEAARRLLSIGPGVDAEALKTARNRAMMSAHPDHGGSEDALRLVIEAYAVLTGEREPAARPETLEISVAVAMTGGRQIVRMGDGRKLAIVLPAGLRSGDKVGAAGTLMSVAIRGRPEEFVSGDDLCLVVRAGAALLANGGKLKVKTPVGYCLVFVPKQVGTNRIVRVLGRGLPARGRHPQGALVLKLEPLKAAGAPSSKPSRKGARPGWAAA
jgi:curved DNA-binding protein